MQFNGFCNLALGKTACQSSTSKWSHPDDASRALADDRKRNFAFHTDIDDNPWWQVDLEAVYSIHYIVIGNRRKMYQERAISLTIETSLDGEDWQLIHAGSISWDDDLVWPLGGLVSARFVRLSLREKTCLHLAKVEVWGAREGGLKAKTHEGGLLWAETKQEGLQELSATLTAPASPAEMILDLGDFYPIWALELATSPKMAFESIKIETSIDGRDWRIIHEGLLFWTGRMYYPLQGEIMARFIKISQTEASTKTSGLWHILGSLLHRQSNRIDWPLVKIFTRRQPDLQVWTLRHDGLGNRLIALLHAMYMAKILGCDYKFVWPELSHMAEVANSLSELDDAHKVFDTDFIQEHLLVNERPNNKSKLHWAHGLCRRHLTMASNQGSPGVVYSTFSSAVDFYHPRLAPPDSYYKSLFESLTFSPVYQKVINAARQVELPPDFVAIHLRSGDLVFSDLRQGILRWLEKTAPVQLAKIALEKLYDEKRPIVLFGEDADELTYLAGLYKATLAADYLPSAALPPAQRDLYEIVLMSRASRIYACLDSLFARCANLIGGNVTRVNLHEVASPEDKTAYLKADLERNADCYHPLQNSFSYLYLYHLNHLTADQEELTFYLNQAQAYDPENESLPILHAAEYFKWHNEKAGEDLLAGLLKPLFDLDQQTIQYTSNLFFTVRYCYHLAFYMRNYFQPFEAVAKRGYSNASAFISIMHDLLDTKDQAMFWRGMSLGSLAAQRCFDEPSQIPGESV